MSEAPETTGGDKTNSGTAGRTGRASHERVVPTHSPWRSAHVNVYLFALLGLVLFLGTIQAAKAMNLWSTSGKVTAEGVKITATGTSPEEIKGWMTIKEVIEAYGVPQEEFYSQFNIPADAPVETPLKDLEKVNPDFSVGDVRTWLTERLNR